MTAPVQLWPRDAPVKGEHNSISLSPFLRKTRAVSDLPLSKFIPSILCILPRIFAGSVSCFSVATHCSSVFPVRRDRHTQHPRQEAPAVSNLVNPFVGWFPCKSPNPAPEADRCQANSPFLRACYTHGSSTGRRGSLLTVRPEQSLQHAESECQTSVATRPGPPADCFVRPRS
jgi:hypothetical protein